MLINRRYFENYMTEDATYHTFNVAWVLSHEVGHFWQVSHGLPGTDECGADHFAQGVTGLGREYMELSGFCPGGV